MTNIYFDGQTYDSERDQIRLVGVLGRVWDLMADGHWRTLAQISAGANGSEASCSARLRDLRKERFGAHTVERRYVGDGLHMYRLIPNRDAL